MTETIGQAPGNPPHRINLGVVLERRKTNHPWLDHVWRPYAVIVGGGPSGDWRVVDEGPEWTRYYAGRLSLELFPGETEGYRENVYSPTPLVFVVLRPGENQHEVEPFLVTACPYEAQDYMDSGDETVEGVSMPPDLIAWIRAFVDRHHVEQPFVKRKQEPKKDGRSPEPFARKPVEKPSDG